MKFIKIRVQIIFFPKKHWAGSFYDNSDYKKAFRETHLKSAENQKIKFISVNYTIQMQHISERSFTLWKQSVTKEAFHISSPTFKWGHEHPLFLALGPKEKLICQVCRSQSHKPLNCIKCDFIICMQCATFPYRVRYKCDKHLNENFMWGWSVWERLVQSLWT